VHYKIQSALCVDRVFAGRKLQRSRHTPQTCARAARGRFRLRRKNQTVLDPESRGSRRSLRLDVGRPDHLAPLFGLVGDKLTEVGGRAWKHCATKVGKPRLDFGIGEARVDLRVELVANASTLGVLCWKSSRENIVSTANFLGR